MPGRKPFTGGRPNPGIAQPRPRRSQAPAATSGIDDRFVRREEPVTMPEDEVDTNLTSEGEMDTMGLRERLRRRLMERMPEEYRDEERGEERAPRSRGPVGTPAPEPEPVPLPRPSAPRSRSPKQSSVRQKMRERRR